MRISRFAWLVLLIVSCTHAGRPGISPGNYPADVGNIILRKCAVAGCHNELSYGNADSLNLSSWDGMFAGGGAGAVVIPYRPDFSPLCFFTNTYPDLGMTLSPTMPQDRPPLTRAEYLILRNWIKDGAPSSAGQVKFSGADRKFYVTNRMCNVVTAIDATSLLQMRYVDVGDTVASRFPYTVKVSPDRQSWYVSFFSRASYVQKFSAADDRSLGRLQLGEGSWLSFAITSDGCYGWFVDASSPGRVVYVDLRQLTVLASYSFDDKLVYPQGVALSERNARLYIGSATGNFIYELNIADPFHASVREVVLDNSGVVEHHPGIDPADLVIDTARDLCYVACNGAREVRVVNMKNDSMVAVIPLPAAPAFMSLSNARNKLFISCPDDTISFPGSRGCVVVADIPAMSVQKKVYTGYQPYGLVVDDVLGLVAVANANISSGGPASHHSSGCGSKNGSVTFIDMASMSLLSGKILEVGVFPFTISAR